MKRLKTLNKKAELVNQAVESGQLEEVITMQTVAGWSGPLDALTNG